MVSFMCKSFSVLCNPICLFLLLLPLPEETYQKILLRLISNSTLAIYSSRNFMVSGLIFKSLIYFDFFFRGRTSHSVSTWLPNTLNSKLLLCKMKLYVSHCFVLFCGSIVALQCYISFCCTMKQISQIYTYIPRTWTSLPTLHLTHLSVI